MAAVPGVKMFHTFFDTDFYEKRKAVFVDKRTSDEAASRSGAFVFPVLVKISFGLPSFSRSTDDFVYGIAVAPPHSDLLLVTVSLFNEEA